MDLYILSLNAVMDHVPSKPTYWMSIINTNDTSGNQGIRGIVEKIQHQNYKVRNIVTIDDVWKSRLPSGEPIFTVDEIKAGFPNALGEYLPPEYKLFDTDTAIGILKHFNDHRKEVESVVVNCMRAKNRSPAVAMALNEIYSLGRSTHELREKYPDSTWYVYKLLLETAKAHPELTR